MGLAGFQVLLAGFVRLLANLLYATLVYATGYVFGGWNAARAKRRTSERDPLLLSPSGESLAGTETISEEVYKSAWLQLAPANSKFHTSLQPGSGLQEAAAMNRSPSVGSMHSFSSTRSLRTLPGQERGVPSSGRYFVVLKNQNLFIYSSEQQTTCLAALCLETCQIDLDDQNGMLRDDELFGLAFPIRISTERGTLFGPYDSLDLSFETGMQKEDWFYALRRAVNLSNPLIMKELDRWAHQTRTYFSHLKRAVSNELVGPPGHHRQEPPLSGIDNTLQVINLLGGRIFFNLVQSGQIERQIVAKFKRKLEISPLPPFLAGISLSQVDFAKQPPLVSHVQLHRCSDMGDLSFFVDVSLTSAIVLVVEGKVVSDFLPLVNRLRSFSIPITVRATLEKIRGRALLTIRRAPSDRVWFGFVERPEVALRLEPVVASTVVNVSVVLDYLETKAIEAINDSVVYPSMEDVAMIPSYESIEFPHVTHSLNPYSKAEPFRGSPIQSVRKQSLPKVHTKSVSSMSGYLPPFPPNTNGSSPSDSQEGDASANNESADSVERLVGLSNISQSFQSSSESLLDELNRSFVARPKSALIKRPKGYSSPRK